MITRNQAYKYAELFQLLSDPQSLMIMCVLEEKENDHTPESLAEFAQCSVSEAERHLSKFENESIVTRDHVDGVDYYQFSKTSKGRFIETVINRSLELYI